MTENWDQYAVKDAPANSEWDKYAVNGTSAPDVTLSEKDLPTGKELSKNVSLDRQLPYFTKQIAETFKDPLYQSPSARSAYYREITKSYNIDDSNKIYSALSKGDPYLQGDKLKEQIGSQLTDVLNPLGETIPAAVESTVKGIEGGVKKIGETKEVANKEGIGSAALNAAVGVGHTLLSAVSAVVPELAAFNIGSEGLQQTNPEATKLLSFAESSTADKYREAGIPEPKWKENAMAVADFIGYLVLGMGAHMVKGKTMTPQEVVAQAPPELIKQATEKVDAHYEPHPNEEKVNAIQNDIEADPTSPLNPILEKKVDELHDETTTDIAKKAHDNTEESLLNGAKMTIESQMEGKSDESKATLQLQLEEINKALEKINLKEEPPTLEAGTNESEIKTESDGKIQKNEKEQSQDAEGQVLSSETKGEITGGEIGQQSESISEPPVITEKDFVTKPKAGGGQYHDLNDGDIRVVEKKDGSSYVEVKGESLEGLNNTGATRDLNITDFDNVKDAKEFALSEANKKESVKSPEEAKIETDPAKIQEIKNSIVEGESILKSGKIHGRKMSVEELSAVQKSVDNAKAKIGEKTSVEIRGIEEGNKIAQENGFDNSTHLLNSVKKRTGEEYSSVQDVPHETLKKTVEERNKEKFDTEAKQVYGDLLNNHDYSAKEFNEKYDDAINELQKKYGTTDEPSIPRGNMVESAEGEQQESKITGVSHNTLNSIASEMGLEPLERGSYIDPEDLAQRGEKLLDGGADYNAIKDKFFEKETDDRNPLSPNEMAVVSAKGRRLAKAAQDILDKVKDTNNPEYKSAVKEYEDWSKDAKEMGTAAGASFYSLRGGKEINTGSYVELATAFKERTGKDLTPAQETEARELVAKVKESELKYEELQKKYTEAMDKWAAEQNKSKVKSRPTKSVLTQEELSRKKELGSKYRGAFNDISRIVTLLGEKDFRDYAGLILKEAKGDFENFAKELIDNVGEKIREHLPKLFTELGGKEKIDPLTHFVDKKDSKFTPDEVKTVWDHAKSVYLDNGSTYPEMVRGVSIDLGLTPKQVQDALAMPKSARSINDQMYLTQRNRRQAINNAKYFVENGDIPKWKRFVPFSKTSIWSSFFFQKSVFGHTGVGMQTHAGMNVFDPTQWGNYFGSYVQQFKNLNKVQYEKSMEGIKSDPEYPSWLRAGLDIDPDKEYAEYEAKPVLGFLGKFFKNVGEAGNRGFGALKTFRLKLAKDYYEGLSETEKADPNTKKNLAELFNNSTGVAKIQPNKLVRTLTFAPRLIASRWNRLIVQPAKAISILAKGKDATPAERAQLKVTAKRAGTELATMGGLLALNQALLVMSGSKTRVNFTDPNKPDWMRFRFGNTALDLSGGMVGTSQFVARVLSDIAPWTTQKDLKGKTRREAIEIAVGNYAFNTISPVASTVAEPVLRHDFNGNTVPWSDEKPLYKTAHKLTWKEYLWQQAPIPAAEAAKDMYTSMHDSGMNDLQIGDMLTGIMKGIISGGTGARVMEVKEKKK